MEKNKVTRRHFIGAGAAALAGLGISGTLMGCNTQAEADKVKDEGADGAQEQTDWLGSVPEIDESEITETIETEVLCVGAGISGLITAAHIGEAGGKAIVIEKMVAPSAFRTDIAGINTRLQKENGVEINKAEIINDIQRYSSGQVDGKLIKIWADESGESVNWVLDLFDEYGIEYYMEDDPGSPDMFYKEWPVTHGFNDAVGAMDALVDRAENNGVEIKLETALVRLERDDSGRISGVIAQDLSDDSYIRINTSKGVVLATGGYASNNEMLKGLAPKLFNECVYKEMVPSQDGDGIKAALWEGALMDEDAFFIIFDRGCVPFEETIEGPTKNGSIWWPGSQPFLRVTRKGERFSNESTPYDFAIYAIRQQHDNTWVQIFDANWMEQVAQFKTVGCSRIVDPGTMPGWQPVIPMEANAGMLEGYVESGLVKKADSIEELAQQAGADAETLKSTIERYNELVEKSEDEDFYKESYRLAPIDTPPFYAARIGGMLLGTLSGLSVNEHMQVLDTDETVIEGLFAVGNDCGGTFARTYPVRVPGLVMGRNITFANRIARFIMEQ